jgi:hypothetical protein
VPTPLGGSGSESTRHSTEYVSLRDYFERLIAEQNKATAVAYQSMERRLDGMNEFRDTLRDQGVTYLTKSEYHMAHGAIEKDVRELRESRALLEGKASQSSVNFVTVMSVVGLIMGIIGIALRLLGM